MKNLNKGEVNNSIHSRVSDIYGIAPDIQTQVSQRIALSFAAYVDGQQLKVPDPQLIRAGKAGGLPFESLTTDLCLGCLPATRICYGNCFAARAAFSSGFNFGVHVKNVLDERIFLKDLTKIPPEQGYLKNGWNSDPSWFWETALELSHLVRKSDRHFILLTKCFTKLEPRTAKALANLGVELRVSLSAMDSQAQLTHRLVTMSAYQRAGGVAVAQLFTAVYADSGLNARQAKIADLLVELDIPAGENSLRVDEDSPVADLLDRNASRPIQDTRDLWCGRLYSDQLTVPPITALPQTYRGLPSNRASVLDLDFLKSNWHEQVPTDKEVLSSHLLNKPRQCGIALDWSAIG